MATVTLGRGGNMAARLTRCGGAVMAAGTAAGNHCMVKINLVPIGL